MSFSGSTITRNLLINWQRWGRAICCLPSRNTRLLFAQSQLHQQDRKWPRLPDYFAIGRTTALALHTVSGQKILYPQDREISEVLLQLPELQNIAGKRALILRGNGGRELIGDTLTARGAEVTFVNVINDAQSITMVQKKRCAGNPAR
ncbi:uroporphyrinogen III synthase [Escherichia coli]|uniref:Uroporphyrinogen III synthase n=1 Tax=Escherichia coli TaxID=562 RepID=A0A2X1NBS5_ECOLX|nr:uroporphyrinogen III synthase [Escherichia coli]